MSTDWIAIELAKPPTNVNVLLWCDQGRVIGYHNGLGDWRLQPIEEELNPERLRATNVTHWAELLSPPNDDPLRLYVCSRWSHDDPLANASWMGALLIMAPDEKSARALFEKAERAQPVMVELVDDAYGYGEPRVIYDDDCR
jgi:hypothetical protein